MSENAPAAELQRWVRWTATFLAAAMSLFHMYAIIFSPPTAFIFRAIHLLFALTLVFLLFPLLPRRGRGRLRAWDLAPLAAGIAICVYVIALYQSYLIERTPYVDDPTRWDVAMAILALAVVLEGTRRVIGPALPITALLFLGYALLFTDVTVLALLDQLYLVAEGIFGNTLGVSATYVLIFVLFGSFMERAGIGRLIMDFALAIMGHSPGGPGKVAVVSSSLFGTVSGSAVANVMVDGPITIPLMKRTGFQPHFAAGVESVASTGGQIMPPIMGAAAFVMAEFLHIAYLQIVVWALVPAALYYVACFGAVHFEAKRRGLVGLPRGEIPRLRSVMIDRGHLFLPILIVLAVMFLGYSPPYAALAGTLACFPVAMLRASTRRELRPILVFEALVEGAKNALSVAMACACAGIVIGTISMTGLGLAFTQMVLILAQDTLLLALIVTAFAGIVLGMGMPTTPAYIIMTALLVPALIKLGIGEPSAHMFAFYFAILSAITPPVALAVYAAASLAKADIWKSGWAALRIGAAGFVVPFMFAYEPALLLIVKPGEWHVAVLAAASAGIGCIALAAGLYGYLLRACAMWERLILVAVAFLLIKPGWLTDLAGFGLLAAILAWQALGRRRAAAEAPVVAR